MPPSVVKLTVISDLLCPWCYIGHKEMQLAIQQSSNLPITFDIEYRPFKLIPTLDEKPVPRREFLVAKYGEEKVDAMATMMAARGAELGIKFAWPDKISQTTDAHRLILKAYQVGGQTIQQKLLDLVFKAIYEESFYAADLEMLADRAEKAGLMSKGEAKKFLESTENLKEVNQMSDEARQNGVTGVPFTVVDGKWAISGGQTSDVYLQVFRKLSTCSWRMCGSKKVGATLPAAVCV